MLDYLIGLLNFSIGDKTYNLITTPWQELITWVKNYQSNSSQSYYSTAVRDAWIDMAKVGVGQTALVIVLLIICTWLFYKIAHGFTGWMKFR